MSSDESAAGRRRPRPIEPPRLPPGPLKDLKQAVYALYLAAGQPTLDTIETDVARLADELDLDGVPKRDTIGRIIGEPDVPAGVADLTAAAAVLARRADRDVEVVVGQVRRLWELARTAPVPYGMIRVRASRPRLLGVHSAIQVGAAGLAELPPYVPRDLDAELEAAIRVASRQGGLVLLVGDSSVGKTRTLYEVVRAALPNWWLLHPTDTKVIRAFAAAPMPRTVLWLDELQSHLDDRLPLRAGTVRELIGDGMVLVATLWQHEYRERSVPGPPGGPNPDGNDRELLRLARVVQVPDTFSANERRRAEKHAADPRIRIALDTPDAGVTQVLAGGPQLLDRWNGADPYSRAILTTALDAARLGVRSPLPSVFLRAAAPGYCTDVERAQAPTDWFERAINYATRLLLGAVAPLTPVTSGMAMGVTSGYRLADYLLQQVRHRRLPHSPPATFWDACVTHLDDPGDLERLGHAADRRMRYRYAIPLLRRAESRDPYLAERLGWLLADQGEFDEALSIFRAVARTNPVMAYRLPEVEKSVHDLRAIKCHEIPSAASREHMLQGLAGSHAFRQRYAHEPPGVLADRLTEMFGDVDDLRRRAVGGDHNAINRLVNVLTTLGDLEAALPLLHALVDSGHPTADTMLIATLVEQGRDREALRLARYGLSAAGDIELPPVG